MSNNQSPKFLIHSNALYERFIHNNLVGYRKTDGVPTADKLPTLKWTGKPIPILVWREILAFFKWSYDTTKSETQVRLFYNTQTGEWRAWAFPQERGTGLSAREIADHPNREADMKQFEGFDSWGTVHHHCAIGAFQSGTDRTDEESQGGLHITVGRMDLPEHEIHSRVSVVIPGELDGEGKCVATAQKFFAEPDLLAWFALPDNLISVLPEAVHAVVLRQLLIAAARADETFPQRWRDNIIETPRVISGYSWQNDGSHGFGSSKQLRLPARGEVGEVEHDEPHRAPTRGRQKNYSDFTEAEINEAWEHYFS